MADKNLSTFGIFSDRISTEGAIEALRDAGFSSADISALFPDEIHTRTFSPEKRTRAVIGAAAGCGGGAALGGLAGWLAGLSAFAVAGPLAGGCAIGAAVGSWIGKRLPAIDEHYESRVRRGDMLVVVQCGDAGRARKAREILKRAGADDVSSSNSPTAVFNNRPRVIYPVREKTTVASLRLVHQRTNLDPEPPVVPHDTTEGEIRRKSAAS